MGTMGELLVPVQIPFLGWHIHPPAPVNYECWLLKAQSCLLPQGLVLTQMGVAFSQRHILPTSPCSQ